MGFFCLAKGYFQCPFLFLGDYVIIGGKLIDSSTSDSIRVHPYKIQAYQTFAKQELMWPYEVIDINQRVYYKI